MDSWLEMMVTLIEAHSRALVTASVLPVSEALCVDSGAAPGR